MLHFRFGLNLSLCVLLLLTCFEPLQLTASFAKNYRETSSLSPKSLTGRPAWMVASGRGPVKNSWNLFGQWFKQLTSAPADFNPVHITAVGSPADIWRRVDPHSLSEISRVDLFIFKGGLNPTFAKLFDLKKAYMLSYKIPNSIVKNFKSDPPQKETDSITTSSSSPKKLSRNQAKKLHNDASGEGLMEIDSASSLVEEDFQSTSASPFQAFDFLISEAMNPSKDSPSVISSIFGFNFSRKYEMNLLQVFIDDASKIEAVEADQQIRKMISAAHPEAKYFKEPIYYWIPQYASKLGQLPNSPPESPLKKSPNFSANLTSSTTVAASTSYCDESSSEETDEEIILLSTLENEGKISSSEAQALEGTPLDHSISHSTSSIQPILNLPSLEDPIFVTENDENDFKSVSKTPLKSLPDYDPLDWSFENKILSNLISNSSFWSSFSYNCLRSDPLNSDDFPQKSGKPFTEAEIIKYIIEDLGFSPEFENAQDMLRRYESLFI